MVRYCNVLSVRKFGPAEGKEDTWPLSSPVLRDRKAQWLDNHVADMLNAQTTSLQGQVGVF